MSRVEYLRYALVGACKWIIAMVLTTAFSLGALIAFGICHRKDYVNTAFAYTITFVIWGVFWLCRADWLVSAIEREEATETSA